MPGLSVEVIRDSARFMEFGSEWREFASQNCPPTTFQTPEWLTTWWAHFGSGDLRVMAFRQRGGLVGVMPGFLHNWNGRRQLTLIGSGISDYLDPLFAPDYATYIVIRIAQELERWPDWEICNWQDLSFDTPLGVLGTVVPDTPCSVIHIEPSFDRFLASRSADLTRNLRRYREKAERIAPVTFEVTCAADETLIAALIELHGERWQKFGEPGMIEANGAKAFLRAIVRVLAERGWAMIFAVRFGGRIVAVLLALCNSTTIFSYLSVFDPQYEKFGFERELLAQAIRYAHEKGYRKWNFLRGDEAYKFSWGARPLEKRRVIIRR